MKDGWEGMACRGGMHALDRRLSHTGIGLRASGVRPSGQLSTAGITDDPTLIRISWECEDADRVRERIALQRSPIRSDRRQFIPLPLHQFS